MSWDLRRSKFLFNFQRKLKLEGILAFYVIYGYNFVSISEKQRSFVWLQFITRLFIMS